LSTAPGGLGGPVDRLRVQANLAIEVDGTPAGLISVGDRLVLSSPHPERLWAAVIASALPIDVGEMDGPRAVGRLAAGLAEAGLRLEVTGPRGCLVHLGVGVHSRVGRALTGSWAVAPGAPRPLLALVWRQARRLLPRLLGRS
jgi:hypothetical protein